MLDYPALGLTAPTSRPVIPGGPRSVAELLSRPLVERPDAEALVDRHARYTFAELDRAVSRAAHALDGLGIGPFDRVAASMPSSAEIVIAFLATMRLGAIWVGVSTKLAPPEKTFILRDAGAAVLLADPATAAQLEPRQAELERLEHVVRVSPGHAESEWARLVARAPSDRRPRDIDPHAPAAIAYTSGTSGFPKGAVHSQHNILVPGFVSRFREEHPPETRHGCILPLTILNLMVLGPVLAYQAGSACVVIDRTDAVGLAAWIRDERIGHFAGVPTILHDLLTSPDVRAEDLRTLRRPLIGGADTPEALLRLYRERFGCELTVGYGMTEAPTAVTMTDGRDPPRPGLCGRALPHLVVQVVDDGRVLPPGEVGEITVEPATGGPLAGLYTPMLGYWGRPDATREALRDVRYHTGDLGELDAAGNLYVRGRRSDLIIRGGANVYPAEVERVLALDPRVAGAAVVGRPDDRLGERIVAFVELAPGAAATADELRARCTEQLARYKVPEEVHFVPTLPRNSMGKVIKAGLS